MKTKLFIIGTFAIGWGWWYLENLPTDHKSEAIKPVDTVAVVSDYLLKYNDSTKVAFNALLSTGDPEVYQRCLADFIRLDSKMDSLLDEAGKHLSTQDFERVIIKIVDNGQSL